MYCTNNNITSVIEYHADHDKHAENTHLRKPCAYKTLLPGIRLLANCNYSLCEIEV